MKVALDTNVLAYAEGTHGAEMKEAALRLVQRLPVASIVLPVQALGELFNVLVLKAKRPATNARAAILGWRDAYTAIDTSSAVMAKDPAKRLSSATELRTRLGSLRSFKAQEDVWIVGVDGRAAREIYQEPARRIGTLSAITRLGGSCAIQHSACPRVTVW